VTDTTTITREVYEAFQRVELHRWDAVIAADVLVNSPAAFGLKGLHALKEFAVGFTHLGWRIDLVDEHLALDDQGNGRGFITLTLHWKHTKDFGGLAPTGREGTSVETLRSPSEKTRSSASTSPTTPSTLPSTSGSVTGQCPTTSGRSRSWLASIGVPDRPDVACRCWLCVAARAVTDPTA
jgi:hypothetical protein